jgi:hypothetical protein
MVSIYFVLEKGTMPFFYFAFLSFLGFLMFFLPLVPNFFASFVIYVPLPCYAFAPSSQYSIF